MADQSSRGNYRGPAMRPTKRRDGRVPPQVLHNLNGTRKPKRRIFRLAFMILGGVTLTVIAFVVGLAGAFYVDTANTLRPRLDKLATYRSFQSSQIVDRNGTLLYELVNQGRRDPVKIDQIAKVLRDATISIENKTFYEDPGIDVGSIIKAAYRNLTKTGGGGASTITQQTIKNVILEESERGTSTEALIQRKFTEIILAQELTKQKSKDEILEIYLNDIPYGNLAYGIQAAARTYFAKPASQLTLAEASLLAGVPQLPTDYNPIQYVDTNRVLKGVKLGSNWLNPSAPLPEGITPSRARQVEVLRQMVLNNSPTVDRVTEAQARAAAAQDLQFAPQEVPLKAPHFVFYIKQALENDPTIGKLLSTEGGLRITTTLDLNVQQIAQEEAARRIAELQEEERNIHNAAVVVLQPRTGQILAMVGSINFNQSRATTTEGEEGNVLDGNVNVTTRLRQPGSALKPFTYLSALEQGVLDPGSILWDIETRFPVRLGASERNINNPEFWYGPKNFDLKWHGPLRMRESLANSLNMPAIKALKEVGVGPTIDLLHRVGITSLNQPANYYGLALTLGGGEVTPLDLTTAYNTLANDGQYVPSTPVLQITNRDGEQFMLNMGEARPAVDSRYVAIIRDFMGDNEARTPLFGRNNPLKLSRPSHAKTGTTEDFRDAWAVGYTPYVTVGVWTGNNNNEKTVRVESTYGGGVIWNRIMERLFADQALDQLLRGPDLGIPLDFPSPKTFGLEQRRVCQIGGAFGQRTTEWFVPGQGTSGKGGDCDLYKTISVVKEPDGGYCLPQPGRNYGDALVSFKVWNLPKSEDDAKIISGKDGIAWTGGSADEAAGVAPSDTCADSITGRPPTPTPNLTVPTPDNTPPPTPVPAPPPTPRVPTMPNLVGRGENQAKAQLNALGITNIVVDYQGRDRAGDAFDQFPPYAVLSHIPAPGTPIGPDTAVVLGIRAPE